MIMKSMIKAVLESSDGHYRNGTSYTTVMVTELEKKHFLKSKMTYDMWLQRYKDRTVESIDVNEHTKWSKEFQAWRVGNIEKV